MKMHLPMNPEQLEKRYNDEQIQVRKIEALQFSEDDFRPLSNVPFLMTRVASDWRILESLNLEQLVSQFPDIEANVKSDQDEEAQFMSLQEYVQRIKVKPEPGLYFKTQFHLYTVLKQHYEIPGAFHCWYAAYPSKGKRFALSWIYIGCKGTSTGLHVDVWNTSAWNLVASGKKLWLFFPPEQECFLYEGKVNPFYPDLGRFPEFVTAKPLVAIQKPGELMYTPSGWWHAVYNLEDGVSLTENFINQTNIEKVKTFFKQNNQLKSLASINGIAEYFNDKQKHGNH